MTNTYPYGFWPSSISADMLTQQTVKLSEPQLCGDDIFWLESRPAEKGRNALVMADASGKHCDIFDAPHSVRTRVHEYGGGSYLVTPEFIICVLDADQRVYFFNRSTKSLTPITPENPAQKIDFRFADFCWDKNRNRIICIREDHRGDSRFEKSAIVAIDINAPHHIKILVSGADFYSNPRINPAGDKLSYLSWNHPQMPWDGTEFFCAELSQNGEIISAELIAGSKTESIFQPQWSPSGDLFFVSDNNNWWNIYKYTSKGAEIICELDAEFATPQWVFGMSTYGFLNNDTIFCCYSQNGLWQLATIDIEVKTLNAIHSTYRDISGITCNNNIACFLAASADRSTELYCYKNDTIKSIAQSSNQHIDNDDISIPQAISFPTSDNEIAHAFYYAPKNKNCIAPTNALPPLIVVCHGGPTGATETSLNSKVQFWTNRGFAVLDINYRGSTGYGKKYRDRLKNNWGITDVIDASSGVHYLVERGLVDENKIAIRGSSAGGYTVLAALTFTDSFKAGASLYGIGDLEALAHDTHKFEAHYLDSLVGEYPAKRDIYLARSPIHHIDRLNCPVIFLQGLQDKVVPPQQAQAMVTALQKKGIKTEYVTFAEEGHGFRQGDNIKRAIEAELAFYQEIFQ